MSDSHVIVSCAVADLVLTFCCFESNLAQGCEISQTNVLASTSYLAHICEIARLRIKGTR